MVFEWSVTSAGDTKDVTDALSEMNSKYRIPYCILFSKPCF